MNLSVYSLCWLSVIGLFSCKKEQEDIAYYKFSSEDQKEAMVYEVGKTFAMVNQHKNQIYFRVQQEVKEIHGRTDDFLGFPNGYYWDFRDIWITSSECGEERCLSFSVQYSRQPIDWQKAQANISIPFPSRFVVFLSSSLWNEKTEGFAPGGKILNRDTGAISLSCPKKTFYDVYMVESGTNTSWDSTGIAPPLVNRIFYSKTSGIIGFDDLEGNQWRLSE